MAWFEPRPGDYNPDAFRQFDYLIDLARRYHIYLHPSLFIGGEVGEAWWDVPWRLGRNPQADPDMLRIETDYAAEMARRYANESAILAWDLTDEPPFWIAPGVTDAMAINWTRLIAGAIRRYDKNHPIVAGTSGEDVGHGPFRPDNIAGEVDFFSVHPYTIYNSDLYPDAMLSARGSYGAAYETALSGSAGHPVMIQELGASSAQYTPERIAQYERAALYSGLGAGANGFLLWCFTDAAPEQFHKVPYLRSPHETQFGLTTWDGKVRPQGVEFTKFRDVVAQMDLSGVRPASADAAIVVPDEWAKPHGDFSHFGLTGPETIPYVSLNDGDGVPGNGQPNNSDGNQWLQGAMLSTFILARQAGLRADMPREYGDWSKRPIVLLPSPLTSTDNSFVHEHTDFWEKAKEYVAAGGVLYASVSADAAIPDMEDLFGARLEDASVLSEVTLKVVVPFGELKPGETFHYVVPAMRPRDWGSRLSVTTGTIIAVDQNGQPALVAHAYGHGKVLLSAYPIEHYLAQIPSAFDQPATTYRIYTALRDWTGYRPEFASDRASVEVAALDGVDHGYVVLLNHSAEPQDATVTTTLPLHQAVRIFSQGHQAVELKGSAWEMHLDPFEGAVFEWK